MSNNVFDFDARIRRLDDRHVDPPGGGGDNGDMEARVSKLEAVIPTLTTKADLLATKEELVRETHGVKLQIADIKADFQKQHIDIQRWMIATVIGLFLGFGGLFLAMSNALKPMPQAAPAQQSPVIINVPSGNPKP